MTETSLIKLDSLLKELKSFVIAFSGGVDSSFLAYRAHSLKNLRMIAVTIRTPYIPVREIDEAVEFVRTHGINHFIIDLPFPEIVRNNPKERCYLCKKALFEKVAKYASENGYRYVLDGTNADDTLLHRPGLIALKELSVRSPLAEAGLKKKEIRETLLKAGLQIWDKPSMACLLTRVPYDSEVTEGMLKMIEEAESYLFEKGYPGTRVRMHNDMARIECLPGYIEKIVNDPDREHIVSDLKGFGFRYVSLDLEGYRTGSMDKVLNKE